MTQTEIFDSIAAAFNNLSDLSGQIYDYWISELYDEEGNMEFIKWDERNLKLMEDDVMNLTINNEQS
jgi:hypothetical protein